MRYDEENRPEASSDPPLGTHLSPAQIVAYRDGELESTPIRQHLEACAACQARLARARHLAHLIRAALEEEAS